MCNPSRYRPPAWKPSLPAISSTLKHNQSTATTMVDTVGVHSSKEEAMATPTNSSSSSRVTTAPTMAAPNLATTIIKGILPRRTQITSLISSSKAATPTNLNDPNPMVMPISAEFSAWPNISIVTLEGFCARLRVVLRTTRTSVAIIFAAPHEGCPVVSEERSNSFDPVLHSTLLISCRCCSNMFILHLKTKTLSETNCVSEADVGDVAFGQRSCLSVLFEISLSPFS